MLLATAWTLAIFVVCWLPANRIPPDPSLPRAFRIPHFDKIVHATMFFGFALTWWGVGLFRRGPASKMVWLRILFAGLALAAITEVGQSHPYVRRTTDMADGMADAAGLLIGLGLATWWTIARKR